MFKKKKKLILSVLFLVVFCFIISTSSVFAAKQLNNAFKADKTSSPLQDVAGKAGYSGVTTGDDSAGIQVLIGQIIQAVLSLLGVIFLAYLIYGGYLWMTDQGNEEQVKKAKSILKNSVIGLVIVVSAYAISYFVMANLIPGATKEAMDSPSGEGFEGITVPPDTN
jgi:TRAP-type C4-dicarboxylate transport system permease small subunit